MAQVNTAQATHTQIASKTRGRQRTLAQRRADLQAQMEAQRDATMALLSDDDFPGLKRRLKQLRKELERAEGSRVTQQQLAERINVPYRTYQSWENAEVETEGENYGKLADFYSEALERSVTKNWILYGQDQAPPLPSPAMGSEQNGSQLDEIERKLDDVVDRLEAIEARQIAAAGGKAVDPEAPQTEAPVREADQ